MSKSNFKSFIREVTRYTYALNDKGYSPTLMLTRDSVTFYVQSDEQQDYEIVCRMCCFDYGTIEVKEVKELAEFLDAHGIVKGKYVMYCLGLIERGGIGEFVNF